MTINDKIKQILIDKNLTPSYFADEIGVQRSSISHILSGRNRPSFDIIQKIIRRFPELGYEWIMEEEAQQMNPIGQSVYPNRGGSPTRPTPERFGQNSTAALYPAAVSNIRSVRNEIPPVMPASSMPLDVPFAEQSPMAEKKVERILIFYSDGSFREYMPSL